MYGGWEEAGTEVASADERCCRGRGRASDTYCHLQSTDPWDLALFLVVCLSCLFLGTVPGVVGSVREWTQECPALAQSELIAICLFGCLCTRNAGSSHLTTLEQGLGRSAGMQDLGKENPKAPGHSDQLRVGEGLRVWPCVRGSLHHTEKARRSPPVMPARGSWGGCLYLRMIDRGLLHRGIVGWPQVFGHTVCKASKTHAGVFELDLGQLPGKLLPASFI
jgi:hypothetical protein